MRISPSQPVNVYIFDQERGFLNGTINASTVDEVKEYVRSQFVGRKSKKIEFSISQGKDTNKKKAKRAAFKIIVGTIKPKKKAVLGKGSWVFAKRIGKCYKVTELTKVHAICGDFKLKRADVKACTLDEKRVLEKFL